MTNYFVIWHIGHGGGGWLLCCCNNHPAGIWLLGELDKPNQLDFEGRGLTQAHLPQEIKRYFADAALTQQAACGIVKCFTREAVEWVWEQGGRSCQMIRNPISKCGGRVVRLDRPEQATAEFEEEYGRSPRTTEEMIEGHMIWIRRKFYDKYIVRATANPQHYPIVRLEDLNQSMGQYRRGGFFKRWIEWLTQVEWPWWYIGSIQANYLPNQYYINRVEWGEAPPGDRRHIEDCITEVHRTELLQDRSKHFPVDPESLIYWEDSWDDTTKELYKIWFADVELQLGYNPDYPGSLSQDWLFRGAYPWGVLDEKAKDRAFG